MTFQADHRTVTEGDVVELTWDCTGSEQTELTIDNGFRATQLTLEAAGSKRFRLNRSKGRTALTITAWKDGKHGSKTLKVKVKEIPATQAETLDSNGRAMGPLRQWWSQLRPRWQSMPADKRLAARIMLILAAVLLFSTLLPVLLLLGTAGLMIYLLYVLWKK